MTKEMTPEFAIKIIDAYDVNFDPSVTGADDEDVENAFIYAIKKIKKDIALKPAQPRSRCGMGETYYDYYCPTCDAFLVYEPNWANMPKRCRNCGQMIDLKREK